MGLDMGVRGSPGGLWEEGWQAYCFYLPQFLTQGLTHCRVLINVC